MTDKEPKPSGPTFSSFNKMEKDIQALKQVRTWLMGLDWPNYVGSVSFCYYGIFWVYPVDLKIGFPEHFQKDMLGLLPFKRGLKREFRPKQKEIYWSGEIDLDKLPGDLGQLVKETAGYLSPVFECGTNTNCRMVPKEKVVTVWELDCSPEGQEAAKAEATA